MISTETIKDFFKVIEKAQNILILNSKPDGDSIGASLALNKLLKKMNKDVLSFTFFPIPEYLRFIVDRGEISYDADVYPDVFKDRDLIILVDTTSLKRSINEKRIDWKPDATFISIDHHQLASVLNSEENIEISVNDATAKLETVRPDTDIAYIDETAESTCGMITEIFRYCEENNRNILIDSDTAFLLFCGIVSDTDYFGYANVTSRTYEHAAFLTNKSFDKTPILTQFRESLGLKAFRFIQRNISRVIVNEEKRYAYLTIKRSDYSDNDNLAVVNEASNFLNRAIIRIIDCVDFSFIIREINDNRSSIAFRRHNNGNEVDLNKIAARFGGGGHKQAAGAVTDKNIDKVEKELVEYLDRILQKSKAE